MPSLNNLRIEHVRNLANDEKDGFKICIDPSECNVWYRVDLFFKGDVERAHEFWTFYL